MLYDRKIRYLDYCEDGERIKNAGFAKLEVRQDVLWLELNVRGLHPTDSFVQDVILSDGDSEGVIGQIAIQEGCGSYKCSCQAEPSVGASGISYKKLSKIRIPAGGNRELRCLLDKNSRRKVIDPEKPIPEVTSGREAVRPVSEAPADVQALSSVPQRGIAVSEKEELLPELKSDSVPGADTSRETAELQVTSQAQVNTDSEDTEEGRKDEDSTGGTGGENKEDGMDSRKMVKLLEDKWQQLDAIYPHINPFQDEREYLSLSPADFVLFPAKYYRAANNSFLLHGYFNYKHLILARVEHRGEFFYYLGVPGNYYDREKQVAIMFGFESFECAVEPAKTGDFGYYLMRVEL